MRGQGHSFATIARNVRMHFVNEPNRRVTCPELTDWYEHQISLLSRCTLNRRRKNPGDDPGF
jgi:hypothetical protein